MGRVNKKQVYINLREKGMTYQEIADIFGVTRQAVEGNIKHIARERSVYPNIDAYMKSNNFYVRDMAALLEGAPVVTNEATYRRWREFFAGKRNPRKTEIDEVIRVTGMTYEELFAPRETGEVKE